MTSPDTEFISILGAAGSPEAPPRVSAQSLPETLSILGLSDIVIFPGMVAPLPYRQAPRSTRRTLPRGQSPFRRIYKTAYNVSISEQ